MPNPYVPPGVTITEAVAAPQVVPSLASSSELVIVGPTLAYQTRTDEITFKGGSYEEKVKLTEHSKKLTGLAEPTKELVQVGAVVTGTGIPAKTVVVAVVEKEVELNNEITAATKEQTVLFEDEPIVLPFLFTLTGSKLETVLSIKSAYNPSEGENEGKGFKSTAYVVNKSAGSINRKNGTGGTFIKPGLTVYVTYTFVPAGFYNPIRLSNLNEVQNRYGNAIEKGAITSPLSLAAQKAFESGAESVICQPLFTTKKAAIEYNSAGYITNAEAPTAKEIAEPATTWETTLLALNLVEVIDLLVPVVGQSMTEITNTVQKEIFNKILGYEQRRNAEEQYIYGVFGEDSTTSVATMAETRKHAESIQSYAGGELAQQNILINTANFGVALPLLGEIEVGGQYMAAAVAGALASRPVASSLTRKGITGFTKVNDPRTSEQKNQDASYGLMVIEQSGQGGIRCRQAISLDNTQGVARQEVSVVRAKFVMVESIRNTLENQIIGQIIADGNSPITVRSAIVGVLSRLQSSGTIIDFETPVCAIASLEPTTITASFSYRPAFTLNYINVVFSLDLSNSAVSLIEQNVAA